MFPLNETGILTNTIKTHETPLPPKKKINKQTQKNPKADKQTQTLFCITSSIS